MGLRRVPQPQCPHRDGAPKSPRRRRPHAQAGRTDAKAWSTSLVDIDVGRSTGGHLLTSPIDGLYVVARSELRREAENADLGERWSWTFQPAGAVGHLVDLVVGGRGYRPHRVRVFPGPVHVVVAGGVGRLRDDG